MSARLGVRGSASVSRGISSSIPALKRRANVGRPSGTSNPGATAAPRSLSAFTLIELILAVAVMSIVLISINAVFFAALRMHDATLAVVDESLPVQQALATMRRDLQGTVPPTANGIMCGDFKVGSVQSTGLNQPVDIELNTTTGVMRDDEPWGDVQRVTYELKAPSDVTQQGRDLYRSVTRNILATVTPASDDQWVLGNVQSVEYTCFDGTSWNNYWDSTVTTNLPLAIRVRIFMASGPRASTPIEMLVPFDAQTRTNSVDAGSTISGSGIGGTGGTGGPGGPTGPTQPRNTGSGGARQ